tara:strand:- start:70 stop:1083 length:1014 start_codon:yes stop_codon:yes gene_type:complete
MNASEIIKLKQTGIQAIAAAGGEQELEAVRVAYLGRKGHLPSIMKGLKDEDPAERGEIGREANAFKNDLMNAINARRTELESGGTEADALDHSLPGQWHSCGTLHPVNLMIEEITQIFRRLGFTVADGPDIETEYHNFDALNTPSDHPSRDIQDTFWLDSGALLRTQTSPVQIRVMESQPPPVRIIAPGRCYRRDTTDATHSANFHQVEGLYVDQGVSLADLKGDLTYLAHELMGPDVRLRFRPHFFPFTEPSVEYDFSCHMCGGDGCRTCKNSGWIEISGAGMVDPRVFEKVGYDPDVVTGYAFGMGVERMAMIKYGVQDIRHLYENDVRFLQQFK